MRFCSPSIARRTKSDRMDPLVGAEGPAGVAGAVGGVPGGVQGGVTISYLDAVQVAREKG